MSDEKVRVTAEDWAESIRRHTDASKRRRASAPSRERREVHIGMLMLIASIEEEARRIARGREDER